MTHHDPNRHLSDDEVLRAMIDPADLDPTRQAHWESCLECRRQTAALTRRFRRLGRMARQMAPEPRRTFRMPAPDAPVGRWHFKPGLALGVLGILIFAFTLWGPNSARIARNPPPVALQNVENDDRLMEEIDMLVEDALPAKYRQLAALSDDRSVEDLDAFMDWLVPSPEEADDLEQSAPSGRENRQDPLAGSPSTVHAEEGMAV